jgi:hypothetical protein
MEQTELKKGTSIDWLMTQLYKKGFIKEIDGNEPIVLMNQAKEMEKQQSDDYAICFSEWCLSELLNGNEPKAETMQGLLEIFKNK